jgi:hypothetical protein
MNTELLANSLDELIDDCFDLPTSHYGLLVFSFTTGKQPTFTYAVNVKIETLLKAYYILNTSDNDNRSATDTSA